MVVRSPLPRPARDACPAGYGGRREPGRWCWDEGQVPASMSPNLLWPTQEGWGSMGWPPGRLGRRVSDHRVPCQTGPRAPARSQGRRGRSLPPAGPRLVTAMGTGLGWGVGRVLPAAGCRVTGSVPGPPPTCGPRKAWGRGTSQRPWDQVRSGEAGSALDPGMSERDCPCEPHLSPRGGSATTCSGGPKAGWVEAPQRTPCPPSPW